MSTLNQERTAQKVKEVFENHETVDQKDILAFVGYAKGIQKNPKMVFGSKGFKDAMKKLGFSVEAADMTIAKILRTGKEENQIKASQEIYKRFGAYEQDGGGKTVVIQVNPVIAQQNDVRTHPSTSTDRN